LAQLLNKKVIYKKEIIKVILKAGGRVRVNAAPLAV
jgi:hypothetical protein